MAKGQQRGKISQLMDSNAAWARSKTHRPKYVLHIPDNDSILELQYMDTETMWKEAKQIFESKKPQYMDVRSVNGKGFLSWHSERIYADDTI